MNPKPKTRFYQVRVVKGSEWARIWLTNDGCISIISDYGNYGYWFGAPACEFRRFLIGCGDDYIHNKLSAGEHETDGEATDKNVRAQICALRRSGDLTREEAREEWELRSRTEWCNDFDVGIWYMGTKLTDAHELICYRTPMRVQMFVKVLWPLFIEQLRVELSTGKRPKLAAEAVEET